MRTTYIKSIYTMLIGLSLLASCRTSTNENHDDHEHDSSANHDDHAGHEHGESDHSDEVHFSQSQCDALKMEIGSASLRVISDVIEVNGMLEVPPNQEAAVTTFIGANVMTIKVIEGQEITKNEVLAYISHPDLITIQTDYLSLWSELQYKSENYKRQKTLYEEKVGSGKEFERVSADYISIKGQVKGLEAQLNLFGISATKVQEGEIEERIAVKSPISGTIRKVMVKTGQYVSPETTLFEIVNIDHIHADFMVFEKDISKVKKGQKVRFNSTAIPGQELEAVIYSVGKNFEEDPKAVHLHAEIGNKSGLLIPGMYVHGKILTQDSEVFALPESAVVREGDQYFVFRAEENQEEGEWHFEPIEVRIGTQDGEWIEILWLSPNDSSGVFALNNAYYLMADLKKGETEHSH